jgi:hypothetical protein
LRAPFAFWALFPIIGFLSVASSARAGFTLGGGEDYALLFEGLATTRSK